MELLGELLDTQVHLLSLFAVDGLLHLKQLFYNLALYQAVVL